MLSTAACSCEMIFSLPVQRAIVVTLTPALTWALASHFKVLCQSFLYVMGKALSGELSCTGTDLVVSVSTDSNSFLAQSYLGLHFFASICLFSCSRLNIHNQFKLLFLFFSHNSRRTTFEHPVSGRSSNKGSPLK